MKYAVDVDSLIACLDYVDSIKVNGDYYINVTLLKEFVQRFPRESLNLNTLANEEISEAEKASSDTNLV